MVTWIDARPTNIVQEVNMKFYWIVAITVLSSCSTQGVMPLGKDTYAISTEGVSLASNPASIKSEAIKEAKDYCASQGKIVKILEADQEGGGYGKPPETDIQFRCVHSR